jgi:anti-sigma factor RsiW
MSEQMPHLGDEIQEYLDGWLDAERTADVRAHLAECEQCREELRHFEWLKARLRQLRDATDQSTAVPADLDSSIRHALDAADRPWRFMAMAAGLAALLAIAIVGGVWWWQRAPTPDEVADDYVAYTQDEHALDYATQDTQALTRYFVDRGIRFRTRVWDLGMMQYTLVGGSVRSHRGRPSALFVYRGSGGERVICQMYLALPPSAGSSERRTHNGTDFTVHRRGDITLVFWQEDDGVTCVLASRGDADALVQLAFAKAERRP